jgi:hypothetical protein
MQNCLKQDGQSFTCRQRINACSAAQFDLFSWKKTCHYIITCDFCILFNWTQRYYMCACSALTLLAADSAVSHLQPGGGISFHVSSILARSLLLPSQMLGGPGPVLACPTPLTALPPSTLSSGSGQFPRYMYLSGIRIIFNYFSDNYKYICL